MNWNRGKGLRFQYISIGESVAMRDDAATLVPSAELDGDVLEMYVAKVSWNG